MKKGLLKNYDELTRHGLKKVFYIKFNAIKLDDTLKLETQVEKIVKYIKKKYNLCTDIITYWIAMAGDDFVKNKWTLRIIFHLPNQ